MNAYFESPQAAEIAFYEAVERADLDAMARVWADVRNAVCIHPGGMPVQGRKAILDSWEQIFQGGPGMHFQVQVMEKTLTDDLAVHLVAEFVRLSGEPEERAPIFATNMYRACAEGWRMVLHHASPTPERRQHHRQPIH